MSTGQVTFNLPPLVAGRIQPDSLESLRSPQLDNTFSARPLTRESVVSEFNDIALDDESFTPTKSSDQTGGDPEPERIQVSNSSLNNLENEPIAFSVPSSMGHRKTASTTTIRSFHEPSIALLMNRLDLQDDHAGRARGSIDGQLRLQEEFARLHEKEAKEQHVVEGAIDWGQSV